MESYPNAMATVLGPMASDHLPLLLERDPPERNFPKPFRFKCFWVQDESFLEEVEAAWTLVERGNFETMFSPKLNNMKCTLKRCSHERFGFLEDQIRRLNDHLLSTYLPEASCDPMTMAARHEIGGLVRIQENFWKRKACDDNIKLGDNNTRYSFLKATRKHNVCAVRRVVPEQGELVEGVENVANVFQVEWRNLLNAWGCSCWILDINIYMNL